MGQAGIDKLFRCRLEPLTRRIDTPEPEPAVAVHEVEQDGHSHHQINPVARRHQVHEPRKVAIGELRLAAEKELMCFAREREHCRAAGRGRRIAAHKPRKLGRHQRQQRDAIGARRAGTCDNQGIQPRDLPVRCRNVPHQIVKPRRDAPETQPRLACDEALQVVRRNDIKPVIANELSEEFGILLHHHRRHIELALGDLLGLLRQCVVRQFDVEIAQVAVREQLLHQMRSAGAFRANTDRGATKIGEDTEVAARLGKQKQ